MIVDPVETSARPKPRTGRRGLLAFFALIGALVAAAVVGGILPRLTRQKALLAATETQTEQRPLVEVATARPAPTQSVLDLPGDMQAWWIRRFSPAWMATCARAWWITATA